MVFWVGGMVFFAFVLAPVAFHTLPSMREAGAVVGASLRVFDIIAVVCAGLFLAATAMLFRQSAKRVRGRYEMEFLLTCVMLLGTAYIQWNLLPAMDVDQAIARGDVASLPVDDPAHLHFHKLHKRSERVEGAVLLLGLVVIFLMSREHLRFDELAKAAPPA